MSNLGLMSSRAKDNFWAPSSDMAAQRAPISPPATLSPLCCHDMLPRSPLCAVWRR